MTRAEDGRPGCSDTDSGKFYTTRVETVFDVRSLRRAYQDAVDRVAPMMSDRAGDSVTCISLTYRPGADDPFADGLQSQFTPEGTMRYLERDFSCFNAAFADSYFAVVHQVLSQQFPIGRMRVMIVPAGKVYRMHADATPRAHLAIHTEPEAYLVGPDGRGYHVPADGRVRVFDTRLRHTAFNAGTVERVHLTMSVADTELPDHVAQLGDRESAR